MAEAIQFLREKIKVLSDEHGDNAAQIERFQAKNAVLDAQIRVLKEVLAASEQSNAVSAANGVPVVAPPLKEVSSNGEKRLGPADSILRLLQDHPHGLTRKAIVAAPATAKLHNHLREQA